MRKVFRTSFPCAIWAVPFAVLVAALSVVVPGGRAVASGLDPDDPEVQPAAESPAVSPKQREADRIAERQAKKEAEEAERAKALRLKEIEKQLRKIRFDHLGKNTDDATRREGLARLRTFRDPEALGLITELFRDDKADTLNVLFEMYKDFEPASAQACLAYLSIYAESEGNRMLAKNELYSGWRASGEVSVPAQRVIAGALASGGETPNVASGVIESLKLYQAIPALITAQAVPPRAENDGYQAWIFFGQQTAYVADVNPIVSERAVAFDPVVGIVNTGVLLKVKDAAVTVYRDAVHSALLNLTREATGKDYGGLGFDRDIWTKVYEDEIKPVVMAKLAEQEEAKNRRRAQSESPAAPPTEAAGSSTPAPATP